MPYQIIVSSFFSNLTNAIVDTKFIVSAVVGGIGIAAAAARNLSEIRESSSMRTKEKVETAKIAAVADLYAKLPVDDSFQSCKKELDLQVAHSVSKLNAIRTKAQNKGITSSRRLAFVQRMFLLFPPNSRLAWVVQGLAYLFMVGGPFAVLALILFRIGDPETVGDVLVLVVFGSIAFRAWALAERRWAIQPKQVADQPPEVESSPAAGLFMLRRPISWKMLAAQVCMWICVFCATESLEDIFLAGTDAFQAGPDANSAAMHADKARALMKATVNSNNANAEHDPLTANGALETARGNGKRGFLLFLASLMAMGICRAWASSELHHRSMSTGVALPTAIFPLQRPVTAKAWLLATGYVTAIALLAVTIIFGPRFFPDLMDKIELVFLATAACAGLNRLLNFCPHKAVHLAMDGPAAWSQEAAAQPGIAGSGRMGFPGRHSIMN